MADLAGEHANLTTVMGIVGDQVSDESDDIGLEIGDFSGGVVEAFLDELSHHSGAFRQGFLHIFLGDLIVVEFGREFGGFVGGGEPHEANIVNVAGDAGDGAAFAFGARSLPGGIGQVGEKELIGLVVDGESLKERAF